jgi:hypothetical protein
MVVSNAGEPLFYKKFPLGNAAILTQRPAYIFVFSWHTAQTGISPPHNDNETAK